MQNRSRRKAEDKVFFALFREPAAVAEAVGHLRDLGVDDARITVMSDVPYEPEMVGRPQPRGGMTPLVLLGALFGIALGLFFTVGTFLLFPLDQGAQPTVPVPPSLIIIFEATMLGTMWAAFFGWLFVNRLPAFGRPAYDVRISSGDIGVIAETSEALAPGVEAAFHESGAYDVQLQETNWINTGGWFRLVGALGSGLLVTVVILVLFWYNVIILPFPTQMKHQASIGYVQGPRLAAPAESVPIQGPVLIDDAPASTPVPVTDQSLQRGEILYGVVCAQCHGSDGRGNGPLGKYFAIHPADLTSEHVQYLTDDAIFLVITGGYRLMPSMAEPLSPVDRWVVINHIRSLSSGGQR